MNLYMYCVNDKGINDLFVVRDSKGNTATSKISFDKAIKNYKRKYKEA